MRMIQDINEHLKSPDDIISNTFLPTLLYSIFTDDEGSLFQLPVRLGGLGIPIVSEVASKHFESSNKITASLVTVLILQGDTLPDTLPDSYVKTLKLEDKTKCEEKLKIKAAAFEQSLSSRPPTYFDAKDPGASNWLSAVPLEEHNFVLNKGVS